MLQTMRRKRRSAKMKNELGQSVDHFKRAASIAAQETSATVGPRFYAARDRVQPAATKARDAAVGSWDSALAAVAAAGEKAQQAGKETKKSAKANKKVAAKNAKKLEKRANKALGRNQGRSVPAKLAGIALIGGAVGVGVAFFLKRRKAAQWDEYDPNQPVSTVVSDGVDDAAFEPADQTTAFGANATVDGNPATGADIADQTSSAKHSPEVARMASGQQKN